MEIKKTFGGSDPLKKMRGSDPVKLVALDLDGTLLHDDGTLSGANARAIRSAMDRGVEVAACSGRPYVGIPFEKLSGTGIRWIITANGAAIYRYPEKELIYEECMPRETMETLVPMFHERGIHFDSFIDGLAYGHNDTKYKIPMLGVTPAIREYITNTRIFVDDVLTYLKPEDHRFQKITLNYCSLDDPDRDWTIELLKNYPEIRPVTAGFCNIEISSAGTSKSKALAILADRLGIPMSQTMACGDAQNDLDIIQAAGIGVGMANAQQCVLDACDYITTSNNEDGVARAFEKFILS